MPVRDQVRDTQRILAVLDAAHRRAVDRLERAVTCRAETLAGQDRLEAAAQTDVEIAIVNMANALGVDLTAQLLGVEGVEVRQMAYLACDGSTQRYELAERPLTLAVPGRHTAAGADTTAADAVTLRLIIRRSPDGHQTPILTNRTDLTGAEIAYRMSNPWRQENYFKYAREHFALDALDSYARLLRPHHSRGDDEARALLREAFILSGDLQITGNTLNVGSTPPQPPDAAKPSPRSAPN
jgi:hypothetical protein